MKEFFHIIYLYLTLAAGVYFRSRRETRHLLRQLQKLPGTNNAPIDAGQLKRIKAYTFINSFVFNSFCTLRGEKPNKKEQQNCIYLAAITPFIDDFTDEAKLSSKEIIQTLRANEPTDNLTLIYARFLFKSLSEQKNPEVFDVLQNVLNAQDESIKQFQTEKLSEKELLKITYNKGGASTLLLRLQLSHPLLAGERDAVHRLGSLIQLINDLFDIYKDSVEGQQSLFTNTTDMKKSVRVIDDQINKLYRQYLNLPYSKKNIRKSLYQLSVIFALAKLASEQLIHCQNRSGGVFRLAQYKRGDLVCDMAKVKNLCYFLKYNILIIKVLNKLI